MIVRPGEMGLDKDGRIKDSCGFGLEREDEETRIERRLGGLI